MPETVLIIDDEPAIIASLTMRLSVEGFEVIGVSDSADALEAVRLHQPLAVVLDIGMPGLDGLDVCRQLKADPRTSGVHVIFYTANLDDSTRSAAQQLDAAAFLSKLDDGDAVIAKIVELSGADEV